MQKTNVPVPNHIQKGKEQYVERAKYMAKTKYASKEEFYKELNKIKNNEKPPPVVGERWYPKSFTIKED